MMDYFTKKLDYAVEAYRQKPNADNWNKLTDVMLEYQQQFIREYYDRKRGHI